MKQLFADLARYKALAATERRIVLLAFLAAPVVRTTLALAGLQRLERWLHRRPFAATTRPARVQVDRIAALVHGATARALGPRQCLTRSIVLRWLLQRQGCASELRIGVRLVGGRLSAHAWVEHEGQPLNEAQDVRTTYAAFAQPISANAFEA